MSEPSQDPGGLVDPDLEPGQVVGEYHVESKLGQGAFGTVFKAVHPLIGKVVAIKVLARRFSVDPEMVSRFAAEARAVNQIRHRNIIDIFSFGKLEDGRQYYAMEYLDGEPLDALVDRAGRLSLAEALPILRGIAKALDAAHAKGIAHRDLKAENVFLASDPDGGVWPKLLDFGIAKLMAPEDGLKHKTRTGAPIGTPYYMSPEQCRGRDVDHRTDLYAFGVLVYRMLTGVYPFDGDDYMSILVQQMNDAPKPPSAHALELPETIDDVVLWLLAKEPSERPADLRTAVRALEQAGEQAGLEIGRPTTGWDAQTGPSAFQTQPPNRRSDVVATPPAVLTAIPDELPRKKSRTPLVAMLAGGAVIVAVALFFLMGRGSDDGASKPVLPREPTAAPQPQPPPDPAPQPAPPPPRVVTPEPPKSVIVTIEGVPEGTEVLIAGESIGAAPGPVQVARGASAVVLTFRAAGYIPVSKSIVPEADQTLSITLKKKARGGSGKPGRDDIIDVFGGKKKP